MRRSCLALPALQINDRYEFPEQLDLDYGDRRFLAQEADQSVRNVYKLHSVLVHSGGVHGGHYYAFIRPDGKQWLKFDDDKVSTVQDPAPLLSGSTLEAICTCTRWHPGVSPTKGTLCPGAQHCTALTLPPARQPAYSCSTRPPLPQSSHSRFPLNSSTVASLPCLQQGLQPALLPTQQHACAGPAPARPSKVHPVDARHDREALAKPNL